MSTGQRRLREKQQRHDAILSAAETVFARKGFDETKMAEIAESAELSKGTLYLYFTGKEELAFAIFLKNLRMLKEMITASADQKDRGIEKIQSILQAYLRFYRDHFYIKSPENPSSSFYLNRIFEFYFQPAHAAAVYAKKCYAAIDEILSIIVEAARTGIRDGSIRPDLDPMKTAVTYGNLVLMFMLRLSRGQDLVIQGHGYTPEELMNHMFDLFINSIAQPNNEEPYAGKNFEPPSAYRD
jgi:AcrR family transcriptional regulator